jgi:8-oxo-dGTP diphosphatase
VVLTTIVPVAIFRAFNSEIIGRTPRIETEETIASQPVIIAFNFSGLLRDQRRTEWPFFSNKEAKAVPHIPAPITAIVFEFSFTIYLEPSLISGQTVAYRNPTPTVDIIIELIDRPHRPIILIERQNPPLGWAIPGGFVDYGESVEKAAIREALEEISLEVQLVEQFHVYSDPARDARGHTISTVFIATAQGTPKAADDAKTVGIFNLSEIPSSLCFDHSQILTDYRRYRDKGIRPQLSPA